MSPLEKLVGFQFSEDIYDHLALVDQLILDLLLEGWQQNDIAELLNVHKTYIHKRLRAIRPYLATTELKRHLEIRSDIKNGDGL